MTPKNTEKLLHRLSLLFCVLYLVYNDVIANYRCSKFNPPNINTNIRINDTSGTIYSPDYSLVAHYPSNTECAWIINGPVGYVIQLTFTVFELEPVSSNRDCVDTDFVRVHDGWQLSSPVLGLYCGRLGRFSVGSTGRFMLVQFRSNLLVEGKGFKANYEVIIKSAEQEPPKGKAVPIAFIIGGITVSIIVVIGIIFIAAGGKGTLRIRKRARCRMRRLNIGSRVSMSSSQARLPSTKSLSRSTTRSETRSLGGSVSSSRPASSRAFIQRNWSLPQLIVTNEEGKETMIFPKRELKTRVLVHASPFSKRRFNRPRRLSSDLPTPPTIRRNQISPLATHAQSHLVTFQSTTPNTSRAASYRRYSSGSIP